MCQCTKSIRRLAHVITQPSQISTGHSKDMDALGKEPLYIQGYGGCAVS